MAHRFRLSTEAVNAAADAVTSLLDGGKLRIYGGTQPANANASAGFGTLLAELTFGTPAYGPAVAGVAAANIIAEDASADASGQATWFRALQPDDTPVFDGSVGTSGADLNLNTVSIVENAIVAVTSLTYTHPKL